MFSSVKNCSLLPPKSVSLITRRFIIIKKICVRSKTLLPVDDGEATLENPRTRFYKTKPHSLMLYLKINFEKIIIIFN